MNRLFLNILIVSIFSLYVSSATEASVNDSRVVSTTSQTNYYYSDSHECGARTKTGRPCKRKVTKGKHCWQHSR